MSFIIQLQHVFQHTGHHCVLHDLNLSVESGQTFALLGPNGAGKSLLLRLLSGLDAPSAGCVQIFGQEPATLSTKALAHLRTKLGMVFQGGAVLNELTVAQNIELPLRETDLPPEARQRAVRLIMMRLNLDGYGEFHPYRLSGGLVRRIELARALIRQPRLLLLDELVDSLDPAAHREIGELIQSIQNEHDITVFLTSHVVEMALVVADHVGILYRGHLLFQGTPEAARQRAKEDLEVRYVLEGTV